MSIVQKNLKKALGGRRHDIGEDMETRKVSHKSERAQWPIWAGAIEQQTKTSPRPTSRQ